MVYESIEDFFAWLSVLHILGYVKRNTVYCVFSNTRILLQ